VTTPAAKHLGARIREARERAGLKQTYIERAAGISQAYLSDIENGQGRRGPSVFIVQAIAQVLGITTSELLGEGK
jgi:transcriptional regulator with XRE-family HTH domain